VLSLRPKVFLPERRTKMGVTLLEIKLGRPLLGDHLEAGFGHQALLVQTQVLKGGLQRIPDLLGTSPASIGASASRP
jgi:hypothetical protein